MKYAGMPFGMWVLMKELGLYDLTPALCHLDYTMSEAGGVTDFVRQYTLASGGLYCDCGYKKKGYRKTISHLPRSAEQEPHAQQERKEDQVGQGEQPKILLLPLWQLPCDLSVGNKTGHGCDQSAKTSQIGADDEGLCLCREPG